MRLSFPIRFLFVLLAAAVLSGLSVPMERAFGANQEDGIRATAASLVSRVAPGGTLSFSLTLLNFGTARRADVVITYRILDAAGAEAYSQQETVAVDTTASVVRHVEVPGTLAPGRYTLESEARYPFQEAPAVSRFSFTVERAYLGVYITDWLRYGGLALLLALASFIGGRLLIRARARRAVLHDYADKPKDERIYYEIISDTVSQMRQRAGDRALEIAAKTKGLSIDSDTGKVLKITENPAQVVAALVSGYEAALGKKVSFALRKNG
ncbi:MAG: hypothetical protein WDN10_04515 [bacterium]